MAAKTYGRGCSRPKREGARRQAREGTGRILVPPLPATPHPMNKGQGKGAGQPAMNRSKQTGMPIKSIIILLVGLALASVHLAFAQLAEEAQKKLQGTWTATKAERDGKAADDVVGNRLSFTGNRFQIQSKDGKPLYAGTVRVDPSAKPAAIDFEHTEGALKGKVWKGIYAMDGDTLTTCDNAPNLDKGRPAAFEAKSGSGYVLITFKRAKP
jgi:uncharacterized protein (TIGR03067 family)